MTTSSQTGKRSRASIKQLNAMLDFFQENPGLASGAFQKLHGKLENNKKWMDMAERLNSVGGAVKSIDQWHTVWRDLKSRTCVRARDRKRQPLNQLPITELERRVIAVVGNNYIEGRESVLENMPIKEELEISMNDGDDIFQVIDMVSEEDFSAHSDTSNPLRCDTPKAQMEETTRRCLKRKHSDEDSDKHAKILDIAQKQADTLKILAECSLGSVKAANAMTEAARSVMEAAHLMTEATNTLAETIKGLGERLKSRLSQQPSQFY